VERIERLSRKATGTLIKVEGQKEGTLGGEDQIGLIFRSTPGDPIRSDKIGCWQQMKISRGPKEKERL